MPRLKVTPPTPKYLRRFHYLQKFPKEPKKVLWGMVYLIVNKEFTAYQNLS